MALGVPEQPDLRLLQRVGPLEVRVVKGRLVQVDQARDQVA